MTATNELKTVLSDPRFLTVWREMQTTPLVLAQREFDEAFEHLRRARAFIELDRLRMPAVGK
jgi:hypothetical protein